MFCTKHYSSNKYIISILLSLYLFLFHQVKAIKIASISRYYLSRRCLQAQSIKRTKAPNKKERYSSFINIYKSHVKENNLNEAISSCNKGIEFFHNLGLQNSFLYASNLYLKRAEIYRRKRDTEKELDNINQCKLIREKYMRIDNRFVISSKRQLSQCLKKSRKYEEHVSAQEEIISILENLEKQKIKMKINAYIDISSSLIMIKETIKLNQYLNKVKKLIDETGYTQYLIKLNYLIAKKCMIEKEYYKSIIYAKKAITMSLKTDSLDVGKCYKLMGKAKFMLQKYPEALEDARIAKKIVSPILGEKSDLFVSLQEDIMNMEKQEDSYNAPVEQSQILAKRERKLGKYKDDIITVHLGKYGAYIKWSDVSISLKNKKHSFENITDKEAIELIKYRAKNYQIIRRFEKDETIKIMKGPRGYYIKGPFGTYAPIQKNTNISNLTLSECMNIINVDRAKV